MKYDAFISYSHEFDGELAPLIRRALEKLGKPWYKKRNLNVFLDDSSLPATPELWMNIKNALDDSNYFIYLASTKASLSNWILKEIEYWIGKKTVGKFILVLTEGEFEWDEKKQCFKNFENNPIPKILQREFKSEPFFVDFRKIKRKPQILFDDIIYSNEILKIASQLHGLEPKDLSSQELKEHQKVLKIRNFSIFILVILLSGSIYQTVNVTKERNIAQANFLIAETKRIVEDDPTLALRLSEVAMKKIKDSIFIKDAYQIYRENTFYKKFIIRDSVTEVAFSDDNTQIIIASGSKAILYNTKGKKIHTFNGHNDWINSLKFSESGKRILTSSNDNTSILWDINGRIIKKFSGRDLNDNPYLKGITVFGSNNYITDSDLSKDGNLIVSSYFDNSVRIWEANGTLKTEFQAYPILGFDEDRNRYVPDLNYIRTIELSPNNERILVLSKMGNVNVYNLNGKLETKIELDGNQMITSCAFSESGEHIITGSFNGLIQFWETTGNSIKSININSNNIWKYYFNPKANKFLTSDNDNFKVWNFEGEIEQELKGPKNNTGGYISGDGKIYTISNSEVFKWNSHKINTIKVPFELKGIPYRFDRNFTKVLIGSKDSIARIFNIKGDAIQEFKTHQGLIYSVNFSNDEKKIITASKDYRARLWNSNGELIKDFWHANPVSKAIFSEDDKSIITCETGGLIMVWDSQTYELIYELNGHNDLINNILVSPNNDFLISQSDNSAILWNLKNGQQIKKFLNNEFNDSKAICFSHNNSSILSGSDDGMVYLWSTDGKLIKKFKGHDEAITTVSFSAKDDKILSGSFDSTAKAWTADGILLNTYGGHWDEVRTAIFSPEGERIITVSFDTAKLWDLRTGNLIKDFGHQSRIYGVKFSSTDNSIFIWTDQLIYQWFSYPSLDKFLLSNEISKLNINQKETYSIE